MKRTFYLFFFHPENQAVGEINSCVGGMDSTLLLQALLNPHAGLDNVQESNALHYLNVLTAMKKSKEEVKVIDQIHVETFSEAYFALI